VLLTRDLASPDHGPPAITGEAERTGPGIMLGHVRDYGERPYLHYVIGGAWQQLSWAEFGRCSLRVAAALVNAGVRAGDRVVLLAENRPEWLYTDLAIQVAGAVTVPIYPTSTAATVRHIVRGAAAKLAVTSGADLAAKLELEDPLRRVVLMDEVAVWAATPLDPAAFTELERRLNALRPGTLATVIYTSGTTGAPKGVMLAQRNLVEMAAHALEVFNLGPNDQILSYLPYSHVMERVDGVFVPSMAGASIWLSRGIDHLAEDIVDVRPTVMLGVPRVFEKAFDAVHDQVRRQPTWKRALFRVAVDQGRRRLSDHSGNSPGLLLRILDRLVLNAVRERVSGGRLRFFISGGAPLSEQVEEFFWAVGVKILQGWGLTESTAAVSSNTETAHRYRTVGRALPGTEVIAAEDGELLVRGPAVMVGYLNDPTATAEALAGAWLHTGDIGAIDPSGFITITDRKKDVIKTAGGKYVAPQPIEARLSAHRFVAATLVIGDQRPYAVALIVPDWAGLAADGLFTGDPALLAQDERVHAFFQSWVDECNSGLATFETIKRFALLSQDFSEEAGELTPTLKPKRRLITEHHRELIDGLYMAARV